MAKTRFSKGFLSCQIFLKEKLKQLFCIVFYKLRLITISESEEKILLVQKLIFKKKVVYTQIKKKWFYFLLGLLGHWLNNPRILVF